MSENTLVCPECGHAFQGNRSIQAVIHGIGQMV